MKNAIRRWGENTGKFKLHIALVGILLVGALFATGGVSWYYTNQMEKQDILYSQQIASLANVLDVNARGTLERLDTLTDKVEFLVSEFARIAPKVDDAAEKAHEAVQEVKSLPKG